MTFLWVFVQCTYIVHTNTNIVFLAMAKGYFANAEEGTEKGGKMKKKKHRFPYVFVYVPEWFRVSANVVRKSGTPKPNETGKFYTFCIWIELVHVIRISAWARCSKCVFALNTYSISCCMCVFVRCHHRHHWFLLDEKRRATTRARLSSTFCLFITTRQKQEKSIFLAGLWVEK